MAQVYADKSRLLPRPFIGGLVVLVLAALTFACYARITDRPLASQAPAAPLASEAAVVLSSDISTGEVWVHHPDGTEIDHITKSGGGFLATLHRVVLRERGKHGVAADPPVLFRAYQNGRFALFDPSTGLDADLTGYGTGNVDTIATLITKANATNGGRTDGTAD
jgi:putative photosynthetic complex assembly protein